MTAYSQERWGRAARKAWYGPVIMRFATGLVVLGFFAPVASALSSISQGYTAGSQLPIGSLVSLEKNSTDRVVAAAVSNVDNLIGVVINPDNSPLVITNGQGDQVQVATSGTVSLLASDINGPITRGDHITASPIAGVGMKATGNVRVVGVAQGSLSGPSSRKESYTDKSGAKHSVVVGEVPVLINVAYFFKEPDKTIVPAALQNVANSLAGKQVSPTPVLISAAIFIIMIVTIASLVYAMIRSSIISIGRNPMSQSAVYRNLIQLSVLVLVIIAVGFGSIYMILTRL